MDSHVLAKKKNDYYDFARWLAGNKPVKISEPSILQIPKKPKKRKRIYGR